MQCEMLLAMSIRIYPVLFIRESGDASASYPVLTMRTKPERGVPPSPLHIHSHARPTRVDPHNRCLRYMYV